jgi:uncharacterized protein (DUF1778 family)
MFFHGFLEATMSADPSQISATISAATKERLDRFTESHGLKKNFVVEQALLFFMEARRELPDEALVPARIVLEEEGFDRVVAMLAEPPAPTEDLRELMRDDSD